MIIFHRIWLACTHSSSRFHLSRSLTRPKGATPVALSAMRPQNSRLSGAPNRLSTRRKSSLSNSLRSSTDLLTSCCPLSVTSRIQVRNRRVLCHQPKVQGGARATLTCSTPVMRCRGVGRTMTLTSLSVAMACRV